MIPIGDQTKEDSGQSLLRKLIIGANAMEKPAHQTASRKSVSSPGEREDHLDMRSKAINIYRGHVVEFGMAAGCQPMLTESQSRRHQGRNAVIRFETCQEPSETAAFSAWLHTSRI